MASASRGRVPDAIQITDALSARAILRSKAVVQAGFGAETFARTARIGNPPVIMLDGDPHRRQRAATARFFSPAVVTTRYSELMEATANRLIERFRQAGRIHLEALSMELAVTIAAEIVGLTERKPGAMAKRMMAFFGDGSIPGDDPISRARTKVRSLWNRLMFMGRDVRPAIVRRRREPREDVISHLISEGYSDLDILAECITYGLAGMITTREFITVAFWQMIEQPDLAADFLSRDRRAQALFLEEMLRTEPVVGVISRRSTEAIELPDRPGKPLPAGTLFQIDVRDANCDDAMVGACPYSIDPDRAVAQKPGGAMFGFGDGVHRCPGAQVALYETAIFLDKLMRVPNVRLISRPQMRWKPIIEGYEIFDVVIACD